MNKLIALLTLLFVNTAFGQKYDSTWESLDSRKVPEWFTDAKFGIFIHWGVYSVPAWAPKGNYAEWYQHALHDSASKTLEYHKKTYGDMSYYKFGDMFKAELFNPDEWAQLFEKSGAKYIVLTSKHHDGFCLWPSKEADREWGFPWNAVEVGPKRDLLGDLFKAVRKTSVHPGMYYSLYEWYDPLWLADKNKFVAEHTWPQMKDLINTYQPDVFWTDGEWDASENVWKSRQFLAWMYNESPVKDKVVTYDRWGSGVRFHHGGVYTPEYQPDLDFEDHPWEESRGMGFSYGYNREEDSWDYNSSQSLVLQLIDKVSRGGNFLLDIGPDGHGKIPPIMQERLLNIGEWLKINGEAIYGTSRWKIHSQWSEGNREYKEKSGDMLLKITIDPDPGYAVKEVFYTYNKKTNSLYAILPKYPADKKLILKDIAIMGNTEVTFLSGNKKLSWKQNENNVIIDLPEYDANTKAPYAFVVKISDFGKFTSKPKISSTYKKGSLQPLIELSAEPGVSIYYTIDGSTPSSSSSLYNKPFSISKTADVKAIAMEQGALPSDMAEERIVRYGWMDAQKTGKLSPGISYKYYEPSGVIDMTTSFRNKPIAEGIADQINLDKKQRRGKFALDFEGYIKIGKDREYAFYTSSDDGSKLFIDDMEIVNNDGEHGETEKSGSAFLKKGFHKIEVKYFDSAGGNSLKASMKQGDSKQIEIPADILFH
ncbi:MAG: alpha-L-fucosidase [Ginsengibacter sp.]